MVLIVLQKKFRIMTNTAKNMTKKRQRNLILIGIVLLLAALIVIPLLRNGQIYDEEKRQFIRKDGFIIIPEDSERVRDAVLFSYQRGEVSLLEVLEAQRTMNEIYMNYYQTLTDYSFSLIELSKNTGTWLVEF